MCSHTMAVILTMCSHTMTIIDCPLICTASRLIEYSCRSKSTTTLINIITRYYFIPPPTQPIILTLLDITPMMGSVNGVVLELQDCALTLLRGE